MAGEVTQAQVSGAFKRVYADKVEDLRSSSAIIQRRIPFKSRKRVGESYQVAVSLRIANGVTYAGASGAVKALKAPRNAVIKQASATPFELDLREQIAWAAMSRAVQEGDAAFLDLTAEIIKGVMVSGSNRVEASLLHGQRGYGTVEAVTDLGGNVAEVQFTAATWAPGLWWAFGEGSTWDCFTSTTKNNASGALIVADGGIDAANRKVKFTFTGTLGSEIAAGDVFYPEGAWDGTTHDDMPGLLVQHAATTGTSLGLSRDTYSNWKPNVESAGGPISHGVVEQFVAGIRDRGIDAAITLYLANKRYSNVVMEVNALRMVDSSYSSEMAKIGVEAVAYISPDVGRIELVNHPFMFQGEGLALCESHCERIGSSDITNKLPGAGGEMALFVPGYNAWEVGAFSDQAIVSKRPNLCGILTGITD